MIIAYSVLAALVLVTVVAFYGLLDLAGGDIAWALFRDEYFYSLLGFTLQQASLSALFSLAFAVPLARALYFHPEWRSQRVFLTLCLLCFVLPSLVLITGLVVLLGRSGWLTPFLGEQWNLYGLSGILIAHVFLNMPFAVRALYLQWQSIPDTSWRLARQLKLSPRQQWQVVEWPVLRGRMIVLAGFIFVMCFNSFAIVLALGGGPQSTTLEVAIYQSLKYDFNIPEALALAWVQFFIVGGVFLLLVRFGSVAWLSVDTVAAQWRPKPTYWWRVADASIYGLAWLFLLLPLLALVAGVWDAPWSWELVKLLGRPLWITLALGLFCGVTAVIIAYIVLLPVRQARLRQHYRRQGLWEWLSMHTLVAPAMVLSVGLYVFLLRRVDVDRWGMFVVAGLNTVVVVPFALQQLRPRLFQFDDQYAALVRTLKLTAWQRLQVEAPWLQSSVRAAFVLVMLLAMGDVAIFAIFGQPDWVTLPWLIYNYASSYRLAEASVAALALLLLFAGIIFAFEGRSDAQHH